MTVLGIRGIAGDTVLRVPVPAPDDEEKGMAPTTTNMTTITSEEEEVSFQGA